MNDRHRQITRLAISRRPTKRSIAHRAARRQSRKDLPESSDDDEVAPRPPDTPTPQDQKEFGAAGGWRIGLLHKEATHGSSDTVPKDAFWGWPKEGDAGDREHHPINHAEWIRLLREQLKQSLDDGITPLGQGGHCTGFCQDLEHEAAIYQRLRPIQGVYVPVFLGAIDLRSMSKTYYYDHRVYIVHMSFLSWGGTSIPQRLSDSQKCLQNEAFRALGALHRAGVIHHDVRQANLLFNPDTNGVMLIDFERASLLQLSRRPLAQLVPNKRKHTPSKLDGRKTDRQPGNGRGQEVADVGLGGGGVAAGKLAGCLSVSRVPAVARFGKQASRRNRPRHQNLIENASKVKSRKSAAPERCGHSQAHALQRVPFRNQPGYGSDTRFDVRLVIPADPGLVVIWTTLTGHPPRRAADLDLAEHAAQAVML
ncbi:hypothetical protein PG994_015186 [Apiospora phragmitis]|uniref:non-specific serine/threonine protein kinase n=1 Tax=Apiospora phragmitis TaxID=2905665 RepID=A0ABR1SXH1_9PEZI